ncbi:hypothetical protein KM043_006994 [Ampulex compressa]|nr:hypothetical protein KM043_006994 [Ampulex compressa]
MQCDDSAAVSAGPDYNERKVTAGPGVARNRTLLCDPRIRKAHLEYLVPGLSPVHTLIIFRHSGRACAGTRGSRAYVCETCKEKLEKDEGGASLAIQPRRVNNVDKHPVHEPLPSLFPTPSPPTSSQPLLACPLGLLPSRERSVGRPLEILGLSQIESSLDAKLPRAGQKLIS